MEIWEGDTGDWTQSLSHFVLGKCTVTGLYPYLFLFY